MHKLGQKQVSEVSVDIPKAFEQLFFKYHGRLVLYANKYLQDIDLSRDVVQEAFYNLWQKSDTFSFDDAPKSYLFQTVKNKSLNWLRYNGHRSSESIDSDTQLHMIESNYLSNSDNPFSSLLEAELEDKMKDVIDALPEKCREIFLMSRYEDLKNREIAEKLQISVKMIEKQMSKALRILREELAEYMVLVITFLFYF